MEAKLSINGATLVLAAPLFTRGKTHRLLAANRCRTRRSFRDRADLVHFLPRLTVLAPGDDAAPGRILGAPDPLLGNRLSLYLAAFLGHLNVTPDYTMIEGIDRCHDFDFIIRPNWLSCRARLEGRGEVIKCLIDIPCGAMQVVEAEPTCCAKGDPFTKAAGDWFGLPQEPLDAALKPLFEQVREAARRAGAPGDIFVTPEDREEKGVAIPEGYEYDPDNGFYFPPGLFEKEEKTTPEDTITGPERD